MEKLCTENNPRTMQENYKYLLIGKNVKHNTKQPIYSLSVG